MKNWIIILVIISLLVIVFMAYISSRRKPKTVQDIRDKLTESGNPLTQLLTGDPNYAAPKMYDDQPVELSDDGNWEISAGTCDISNASIVNWDAIKGLSQKEKNLLYAQIDACNLTNVPLKQP